MARIECPECESVIPAEVTFCPECGFAIKTGKVPDRSPAEPAGLPVVPLTMSMPTAAMMNPSAVATSSASENCAIERYGFIGDYIGIAANADGAWAAWTDLRDLTDSGDICAVGHSCAGNRNQSIHAVRIPR